MKAENLIKAMGMDSISDIDITDPHQVSTAETFLLRLLEGARGDAEAVAEIELAIQELDYLAAASTAELEDHEAVSGMPQDPAEEPSEEPSEEFVAETAVEPEEAAAEETLPEKKGSDEEGVPSTHPDRSLTMIMDVRTGVPVLARTHVLGAEPVYLASRLAVVLADIRKPSERQSFNALIPREILEKLEAAGTARPFEFRAAYYAFGHGGFKFVNPLGEAEDTVEMKSARTWADSVLSLSEPGAHSWRFEAVSGTSIGSSDDIPPSRVRKALSTGSSLCRALGIPGPVESGLPRNPVSAPEAWKPETRPLFSGTMSRVQPQGDQILLAGVWLEGDGIAPPKGAEEFLISRERGGSLLLDLVSEFGRPGSRVWTGFQNAMGTADSVIESGWEAGAPQDQIENALREAFFARVKPLAEEVRKCVDRIERAMVERFTARIRNKIGKDAAMKHLPEGTMVTVQAAKAIIDDLKGSRGARTRPAEAFLDAKERLAHSVNGAFRTLKAYFEDCRAEGIRAYRTPWSAPGSFGRSTFENAPAMVVARVDHPVKVTEGAFRGRLPDTARV